MLILADAIRADEGITFEGEEVVPKGVGPYHSELDVLADNYERQYTEWMKDAELRNRVPITCDRCIDPGHCCKAFPLSFTVPPSATADEMTTELNRRLRMSFEGKPAFVGDNPFKALRRVPPQNYEPDDGQTVSWLFQCTALQADGRCGIYERRPDFCRIYEPGTDWLCVHRRDNRTGKPFVPQKDQA